MFIKNAGISFHETVYLFTGTLTGLHTCQQSSQPTRQSSGDINLLCPISHIFNFAKEILSCELFIHFPHMANTMKNLGPSSKPCSGLLA